MASGSAQGLSKPSESGAPSCLRSPVEPSNNCEGAVSQCAWWRCGLALYRWQHLRLLENACLGHALSASKGVCCAPCQHEASPTPAAAPYFTGGKLWIDVILVDNLQVRTGTPCESRRPGSSCDWFPPWLAVLTVEMDETSLALSLSDVALLVGIETEALSLSWPQDAGMLVCVSGML